MFKGEAGRRTSTWSTSTSKAARTASTSICSPSPTARARGPRPGVRERRAQGADATPARSDLDFLLDEPSATRDEEPTREIDPLARTQETPTIESPMIDRSSQTMREKVDQACSPGPQTEQTAELSLDDLGLDVDSLEQSGALEDTTSLEKDTTAEDVGAAAR